MTISSSVASGSIETLRVDVTYAKQKFQLPFPAAQTTIGELKASLERCSGVPRDKQRLLFGAPVVKERRRERGDAVLLADLLPPERVCAIAATSPDHHSTRPCSPHCPPTAAVPLVIPLMLIGTAAAAPPVDEGAMAQLHRLLSTTVEDAGRWCRCSYGRGYLAQAAFVCRTCVQRGLADAAHAVCLACAEVCHAEHEVEEWGVRHHMRCDCCTAVCWRGDGPSGCRFIVDPETGAAPPTAIVPRNGRNRYPRQLHTWCYCAEDHAGDETGDGGGGVCALCATCFWCAHLTRLHTAQYRRVPCYGDVVQGDTLAFHCATCETLVCAPCRLRCHAAHEVDDTAVSPSREDGTDNGAPDGVRFSCGCRGCCGIAEAVPPDALREALAPISAPLAAELMRRDVFVHFVCGRCMQEHPWLLEEDPRRCWGGQLPDPIPAAQHLPMVPCGLPANAEVPAGHYPFHAMLVPADTFTAEATCGCAACREAFARFAPRAPATANDMMVQLHDACDHCGHTIRDEQAFMCQTCELQHDRTFFVCKQCNKLRMESQLPPLGNVTTNTSVDSHTNNNNNNRSNMSHINNSEHENQSVVQNRYDSEVTPPVAHTSKDPQSHRSGDGDDVERPPWDHPLTHVFLEDTYENLYALCGIQLMSGLDSASREEVLENIDETSASLEKALQSTFGGTPLVFDPEEVARHHKELVQRGNDVGQKRSHNERGETEMDNVAKRKKEE